MYIEITKIAENRYKITNIYHSNQYSNMIWHGDKLKNNQCIYSSSSSSSIAPSAAGLCPLRRWLSSGRDLSTDYPTLTRYAVIEGKGKILNH